MVTLTPWLADLSQVEQPKKLPFRMLAGRVSGESATLTELSKRPAQFRNHHNRTLSGPFTLKFQNTNI
jgi:hypothetical protein